MVHLAKTALLFQTDLTQPFKRQPHKMVKHTQAIRGQQPSGLSMFDHFVGLALNRLKRSRSKIPVPPKFCPDLLNN